MLPEKGRKLGKLKLTLIGGLFAIIGTIAILANWSPETAPLAIPPYLGNRPEVVSLLPERASPGPFRFLVLGDMEDRPGRYEKVLKQAVKGKAAFIVVTGDLVNSNREERWRFFVEEVREKLDRAWPPVALFGAPGNHDVDPDNKGIGFDQVMGARQFYFSYGGSLFVILDSSSGIVSQASYQWFRELLVRERPASDHVFLFLHYPPISFPGFPKTREGQARWEALYEPLRRLAEEYGVEYIFSGHYEGYYQEARAGVTYVITGGGGSRLEQPGGKHHFMQVEVSGRELRLTKVDIPSWPEVNDEIEGFLRIKVLPFLRRLFQVPYLLVQMMGI